MKKKLLSQTYLREVSDYSIKIDYSQNDYYLSVKKINNIKEPFVLSNGLKVIDNNYYILELIPKNEYYCMRVFFDNNKKILEYYFDIIKSSGIDPDNGIPYYDDLYLDVVIYDNEIEVLDENELLDALNSNIISKDTYDFAYTVMNKLLFEINSKSNKYINMDLEKLL